MRLNVDKIREVMRQRGLTQTELARLSGVSRATIAGLLGKGGRAVRSATEAKLATALGLAEGALDRDAVQNAYLDSLAKQHAGLDFSGMGVLGSGRPMPMDVGYLPISVREWRQGDPCVHGREHDRHRLPQVREPRSCPLPTALARGDRLFLLGDPGSGKTTTLRYLARLYATGNVKRLPPLPEGLVPVFLRVAD